MQEKQLKMFENVREKTNKEIEKHKQNIKLLEKVIEFLKHDIEINIDDNIEMIILKKYIETGSAVRVKSYLDEEGYKVKTDTYVGERNYKTTDIMEIVGIGSKEFINEEMKQLQEIVNIILVYRHNGAWAKFKVLDFNVADFIRELKGE